MKLSKRTLQVLKNFHSINTSIIINEGNLLYTSRDGSIFAWTTVEEKFPTTIPIYNLSEFVAVVEKSGEPKIEFGEDMAVIANGRSRTKYKYTAISILERHFKALPFKSHDLPPGCKHIARVGSEDVVRLRQMSSVLSLGVLQLKVKGGAAILRASKGRDKENVFEIGLSRKVDMDDCLASIDLTKFVLINDDYQLHVVPEKALVFQGESHKINYLIMLDIDNSQF